METARNPKRLYFAHAVNIYNTPLEAAVVALFSQIFPGTEVENPNQPHHQVGYDNYAKRAKESGTTHKGMSYFYDEVLPLCDACVAMPFLDGRMGLGVASEAQWFAKKNLPVWTVRPRAGIILSDLEKFIQDPISGAFSVGTLSPVEHDQLMGSDPALVVPHEETRLRTWYVYNRQPRPYEEAHLVSMPLPEGFYPAG